MCIKREWIPLEQRALQKSVNGTLDCLIMDTKICKKAAAQQTNISMAWLDFSKAFDTIPYSIVLEFINKSTLEIWIKEIVCKLIKKWGTRVVIRQNNKTVSYTRIRYKRVLMQDDAHSLIFFC